jgi:hypothetical protein
MLRTAWLALWIVAFRLKLFALRVHSTVKFKDQTEIGSGGRILTDDLNVMSVAS